MKNKPECILTVQELPGGGTHWLLCNENGGVIIDRIAATPEIAHQEAQVWASKLGYGKVVLI